MVDNVAYVALGLPWQTFKKMPSLEKSPLQKSPSTQVSNTTQHTASQKEPVDRKKVEQLKALFKSQWTIYTKIHGRRQVAQWKDVILQRHQAHSDLEATSQSNGYVIVIAIAQFEKAPQNLWVESRLPLDKYAQKPLQIRLTQSKNNKIIRSKTVVLTHQHPQAAWEWRAK